MANTLTNLIPHLYTALNMVSRELVGFIPAVTRDGAVARAAVGQSVRVPVAPQANVSDISPAMTAPEPTDQVIGTTEIKITKSRAAEFGYVGEEILGLNTGPGVTSVQTQQIAEGIRALTNEIESDLAAEAYKNASRAYGTAGTTPFATNLKDSAQVRKILDDNGAPPGDRSLIISTTAGAGLRTLTQLTKANEAADNTMLRQGTLLDLHGFMIGESGKAVSHSKGSATGFLSNAAHNIGDTEISVDSGTGAISKGDIITFAGDATKYVVAEDFTGGSGHIAAPGLRKELADNVAITVGDSYEANVAFSRSALQLASRAPALPDGGDMAMDRHMVSDMRSGMVFEMSSYAGYRKVRYEIAAAWGVKNIKPEHTALLLG